MKIYEGIAYLKIGEVAKKLGKTPQTIKHWYGWAELNDKLDELPPVYSDLDKRGTRYFNCEDVEALMEFSKSIEYGKMADYNSQLWGKRGRKDN